MTGSRRLDEGEPSVDSGCPSPIVVAGGGFRVALKKRAEFQRASRGRRSNARSIGLQAFKRPEAGDPSPRFGLTVTKRVGNAVERNRIKRRLRAALRAPGLAPDADHDYVIVARREALGISFRGLIADLVRALDHARSGRAYGRHGKAGGRPPKSVSST